MLFCICLFFSVISLFQCANIDYDGIVRINLYHDLLGELNPHFIERGNVTVTSLRSGTYRIENTLLSDTDKENLKKLGLLNKFYRLYAVVQNYDGSTVDLYTFSKACMLVENNLSDSITISLDHLGLVVAVTHGIPDQVLCNFKDKNIENLNKFNTTINVQHTELGPIPDTASYIQKIEREREARERGESKDNRSFLAKYWMYIIPIVVFMIASSAANPEGAAGGGGNAGGR